MIRGVCGCRSLPIVGLLVGALAALAAATELSAAPPPVGGGHHPDRVVVKFQEGSLVRLRAGQWMSLGAAVDLGGIEGVMARHPGALVRPRFTRSETELDRAQLEGEARSGQDLADLNLYYEVRVADPAETPILLDELNGQGVVQTAFLDPIVEPAALDGDAIRGDGLHGDRPRYDGPRTIDYTPIQGYIKASPNGVNAEAVWVHPGGRAAGVKLIDIEGAWLWSHEDLKPSFFEGGTQIADANWRNHGTAVLGEMVGQPQGFGINGICSDLEVGAVSIGDLSVAAAIDLASSAVAPGDLFLIELHAPGPNANGSGQFGYVPMEWWQDNFDAIQTAVALGRICVEAGGNGEQNLDDAVYAGLFDRNVRDSGAIMVGAGTPTGHVAEWFTNYGSRVDLNGWGSSVTTTGYGTLQGGDETQWYTSGFAGTSSASPIVAGSIASLQGMCKAHWGITLDAKLALTLLSQSGTPYSGTKRIGPRPNLVAARALLLNGIGVIEGIVRDGVDLTPIEGARIRIVETGSLAQSASDGTFALPVQSGTYQLEVTEFFHEDATRVTTVSAGEHQAEVIDLLSRPTGTLAGTIRSSGGIPLAGAQVHILEAPLAPATSGIDGAFSISGVPAAFEYAALIGLSPGRGAVYRVFDIIADNTTIVDATLPDAQSFESNNGSYQPQAPWAWGVPSGPGPGGAFSGAKLWATNLGGNYGDNQSAYLTSPVFSMSGVPALNLSFTHWYDLESGFDGGNVQVKNGASWVTVAPRGGYPIAFLDGLSGEAGFSGQSGGWAPVVYDLSPFISGTMQFRFHFGSDGGVNAAGWYIDDVALDTGPPSAGVDLDPRSTGVLESPAPNPTRGGSDLRLVLRSKEDIRLRVLDAGGREVRRLWNGALPAGASRLRWDGRDAAERECASGIYWLVLERPSGAREHRRLVLLR